MATSASAEMLSITPWPDSSSRCFILPAPLLSCTRQHCSSPVALLRLQLEHQQYPGPYGPCKAKFLPEHRYLLQSITRPSWIPFPFADTGVQQTQAPITSEAFQEKKPPLDRKLNNAKFIFPKVLFSPESMEGKQHSRARKNQQYHVKQ